MKSISIIILISMIILSCSSISHLDCFQLYKTASNNLIEKNGNLIYENSDVLVVYNLWDENGNIGFVFFNKTDSILTIKKDESFFIYNGFANDYFQNRSYSYSNNSTHISTQTSVNSNSSSTQSMNSKSNSRVSSGLNNFYYGGNINSTMTGSTSATFEGTTNSVSHESSQTSSDSKGFAISFNEQNEIKIPPHSAKMITEFSIVNNRYINCNLNKYPDREIISVKFEEQDSPIKFSNIISYNLNGLHYNLENSFYVNEIMNLSELDFYEFRKDTLCGRELGSNKRFPKLNAPNSFYYIYN